MTEENVHLYKAKFSTIERQSYAIFHKTSTNVNNHSEQLKTFSERQMSDTFFYHLLFSLFI